MTTESFMGPRMADADGGCSDGSVCDRLAQTRSRSAVLGSYPLKLFLDMPPHARVGEQVDCGHGQRFRSEQDGAIAGRSTGGLGEGRGVADHVRSVGECDGWVDRRNDLTDVAHISGPRFLILWCLLYLLTQRLQVCPEEGVKPSWTASPRQIADKRKKRADAQARQEAIQAAPAQAAMMKAAKQPDQSGQQPQQPGGAPPA